MCIERCAARVVRFGQQHEASVADQINEPFEISKIMFIRCDRSQAETGLLQRLGSLRVPVLAPRGVQIDPSQNQQDPKEHRDYPTYQPMHIPSSATMRRPIIDELTSRRLLNAAITDQKAPQGGLEPGRASRQPNSPFTAQPALGSGVAVRGNFWNVVFVALPTSSSEAIPQQQNQHGNRH